MYDVILYYKFYPIANPEQFCRDHKYKCQELNLRGRIYIASEGINGTLAGRHEDMVQYKEYLRSIDGFGDTQFKEDVCDNIPFVKLTVKTRPEIVTLKASVPIDPSKEQTRHLSPKEWREALESDEDYLLLDVRNNYESAIGHFEGAICPDTENFYDFEQWLDHASLEKEKKVLMYCTGGIRCEKYSLLMQKKGFRNVNQLEGGIINYAQKEGGAHYRGKCFVFDDRLAVPVESNQQEPLTHCEITGAPCDQYLNCGNPDCNKLFVCSVEGAHTYQGCCSVECSTSHHRRPFDPNNIYAPSRRWYNYFSEKPKRKDLHDQVRSKVS